MQTIGLAAKAISLGIRNPNSSGQGRHDGFSSAPYCRDVIALGWPYSHTTNVVHQGNVDVLTHTFRRGDHAVTFWIEPGRDVWRWAGSWGGSGVHQVGDCGDGKSLLRYLRGVRYRARKQGREGF